ncbi:hypothetical protein ACJMK2_043254 [Sinanodonta woodiana]|uniref:Uncharacterized protein n=1 Tax=Sinanodonta woodiana TaxID=1069815 RepID=A0ABD3VWB9_SINWO
MDSWSVYERSIRTNKDSERWHNRFNRIARKANSPFFLLLTLLYKEARYTGYVVHLVQEGKIRQHQNKQTTNVQGRLNKLWENNGNHLISTNTLLKCCARLYCPC